MRPLWKQADLLKMHAGQTNWSEQIVRDPEQDASVPGALVSPTADGTINWEPPAYSPDTGLFYVTERNGFEIFYLTDPDPRGYLKAIDPMTGQAKWQTGFKSPNWAGTLVTAGGLVFTGELTGEFIAVDADTGKIVWQFQTPSGIIGQPVTWEKDGVQYVTVTSGIGGVYARQPDPNIAHVPKGGSLWTFKLLPQ